MLTSKQRAYLRSLANSIETIIMFGKGGLSDSIYKTTDEAITARELIKGKVLFWLGGVGSIVEFIKTPVGTLLIIAAAILLVELPRLKKKKSDDEQKQKIIDEINKLRGQD